MKKIPQIIHQIWFQGIENIREPYKYCHETVKKGIKNTNWKLKIWDENSILNFINYYYPQYRKLYDSYDLMIMKIDLARYIILYHYGGVYIDMDMEWIKDFSFLIDNDDELIINKTKYKFYNNGVIFSKPKCKFWEFYLNCLTKKSPKQKIETNEIYVFRTTGPIYFTYAIIKYMKNNKVKTLEPCYFESSLTQYNLSITDNSVMKNHLGNSWLGNSMIFFTYIIGFKTRFIIILLLLTINYLFYKIN